MSVMLIGHLFCSVLFIFFTVLRIEHRVSLVLCKLSPTELQSQCSVVTVHIS